MLTVEPYAPARKAEWDAFNHEAVNGHFQYNRDYMEYHADRFVDASLIVRNEAGKAIALLPAHALPDHARASHNGLSFGGFIVGPHMTTPLLLDVWDSVLTYWQLHRVDTVLYKTSPYIYHSAPADTSLIALYLLDAPIVRRCALSVIMPDNPLDIQERRLRGVAKAERCHLYPGPSDDWAGMWRLLAGVLPGPPTHTLDEILTLRARFPRNIKLYGVESGGKLCAGIVVYETPRVARFQYIAASTEGKHLGASDLLTKHLIEMYTMQGKAIDMGTSDTGDGRALKRGIMDWKEGWGSRTVAYAHYLVNVAAYEPGTLLGALV